MSQYDKKEIAKAKFITGESIQAIADQLEVNRRTIERWADDGNWRDLRQGNAEIDNVVSINSKPAQKHLQTTAPPIRSRKPAGTIDDLETIERAIAELAASLPDAEDKSKGGIATALCRLIEFRQKLQPKTAADLAEMAIALGIQPAEFARQLRERWQLKA